MASTPAMHASPPDTTDTRGDARAATAPASASPNRGPPVTTAMWMADNRPRSASGTVTWRMVLRNTAETMSAAPAKASSSRATGNHDTSPNTATTAPNMNANVATSTQYTAAMPAPSMIAPPTMGPTAAVVVKKIWNNAAVAASWSRRTRRGTAAVIVGESSPETPAASPLSTYSG